MARPSRYSPEVRERAVRLFQEHVAEHPSPWAAMASIASKLGCTPETLRKWVRQAEARYGPARRVDHGRAPACEGARAGSARAETHE